MKTVVLFLTTILFASPAYATHVYANYSCTNKKFELNYDGPGSNYAFGGYSHLIRKKNDNSKHSVLSYEMLDGEDDVLGEVVGEETVHVLFGTDGLKRTSAVKSDLKVGDTCVPGETDYQHSEWTSIKTIAIIGITPEVAAKFGIKKGDRIKMTCAETQDTPVSCPTGGKYDEGDLPF